MRKYLFFLPLFIIFYSCTTGVKVKENNSSSFLHDGNSKVWMISEIAKNDFDYSDKSELKDLFIFYANGECVLQSKKEFSMNIGELGSYEISNFGKSMHIDFENDKWEFTINKSPSGELRLMPTKNSDFDYSLTLIPFPQLIK